MGKHPAANCDEAKKYFLIADKLQKLIQPENKIPRHMIPLNNKRKVSYTYWRTRYKDHVQGCEVCGEWMDD